MTATISTTQLAGPGMAGVLVELLGAATTLLTDAFSYLVSFASVWSIRGVKETHVSAARSTGGASKVGVKREIAEGLRYFRGDPILMGFLGCVAQFNFFIVAEEALFVIFLVKSVHAPTGLIGVLLAASGVGAVLGAVGAQRLSSRLGAGPTMVLGATIGPLLGLLIPLTHENVTLLCFVAGTAGLGATTTVIKVIGASYRQASVPTHLLGRVVSISRTLTWGPLPLAAFLGGLLGQLLGPRTALALLSLLLLAAPLWLVTTPVWKLRDLVEEPA
jgi:Na+/melibiose symporter-like transporter